MRQEHDGGEKKKTHGGMGEKMSMFQFDNIWRNYILRYKKIGS